MLEHGGRFQYILYKLNGGELVASIKDIAVLAGVSRGTVDRALNNREGVNREVAERIRRIAADKGYKTNRAALGLAARKRPFRIGAIFPVEGNMFFEEVIDGVHAAEETLSDNGVSVLIKTMKGYSVEGQLALIDKLCEEGIQALVIVAANEHPIAQRLNELVDQGIPVVACNTDIEGTHRLCYVGTDYLKNGRIAAGLMALVADGKIYRTVILTGSIHVLGHNQRISGFHDAVTQYHPNIRILDVFETLDDVDQAYGITLDMLHKYKNIDAIYMTAGGIGGACRALTETGNVGKIKLFTHDCTSETKPLLESGIISATICQDPFQQGYMPVMLLFDYFLDKQTPAADLIYTKIDILIRESVNDNR